MKFIPMLFSTLMAQAIEENRKTKTRRTKGLETVTSNWAFIEMDESSDNSYARFYDSFFNDENNNPTDESYKTIKCPYGKPGDVIWVRETWQKRSDDAIAKGFEKYYYKAGWNGCTEAGWKPNIHMPKTAARYFLKIKSITVEKLQDITEADAKAEGVEFIESVESYVDYRFNYMKENRMEFFNQAKDSFQSLWQSINGEESWKDNPFVWVIEFERIEKPQNFY